MDGDPDDDTEVKRTRLATFYEEIYAFALQRVRNETEAEDLTQAVFRKALSGLHTFERGSNMRAWLYCVFRSVANRRYNRQKKQSKLLDEARHDIRCLPTAPPKPDANIDAQLSEPVSKALEDLPEDYRRVVLLRDLQVLTYAEIADLLSIPIGTVMSRLCRARKALRRELATYCEAEGLIEDADTYLTPETNLKQPGMRNNRTGGTSS